MPRKRRRKRRATGWTETERVHLLSGHDFFGEGFGREGTGTFDEERARQAWFEIGDELVAEHIHRNGAGTRPWAWWRWSAPEPRRRVDGGAERPAGTRLSFGRPAELRNTEDFEAEYESEREFLARLGLLAKEEPLPV